LASMLLQLPYKSQADLRPLPWKIFSKIDPSKILDV
jgi:hypothetical protein